MNWPYRLQIEEVAPEDGGGLHACFPTLGAGVAYGVGDDFKELATSLHDGVATYLDYVNRHGLEVPAPSDDDLQWCAVNSGVVLDFLQASRPSPTETFYLNDQCPTAANNNYAFAS